MHEQQSLATKSLLICYSFFQLTYTNRDKYCTSVLCTSSPINIFFLSSYKITLTAAAARVLDSTMVLCITGDTTNGSKFMLCTDSAFYWISICQKSKREDGNKV